MAVVLLGYQIGCMRVLETCLAGRVRSRSSHDLVGVWRQGDEQAWGDPIDRYERLIFSVPLRRGLSREDVSEIFHSDFPEPT